MSSAVFALVRLKRFTIEEVHHGARIHLLSGEHAKRTLETCKTLVEDNALLGQMKTGALAQALETFFQKAITATQPASEEAASSVNRAAKRQKKRRSRPLLMFGQRPKPRQATVKLKI